MKEIITSALMSFGAGFTTAAITKAQGPGRALDDIMTLVGFDRLHEVAEKKRAKRDLNILRYKESIAQKIASIPDGNLQEPPLSVVGPALEASKYYIEEEILREMFANVISASMDKTKSSDVHHSFVEVITQLSPEDALFLKEFEKTTRLPYGIVRITEYISDENKFPEKLDEKLKLELKRLEQSEKLRSKPFIDYFYYSKSRRKWKKNEFSISSLSRLGILNIQEGMVLSNKLLYSEIKSEFSLLKKQPKLTEGSNLVPNGYRLELQKGIIDLSPFGRSFFNTCV